MVFLTFSKAKISNIAPFILTFISSVFGFEFLNFIMTLFIYNKTKNPFYVSIFASLLVLPRLAAPYYGIINDKYNKKITFSISFFFIGVLIFVLSLYETIIMIYIIWFFIAVFYMFSINARSSLITEIIPKKYYNLSNSFTLITFNTARVAVPAIMAYLLSLYNLKLLISFVSIIYIIGFIFSFFINYKPLEHEKNITSVLEHFKSGIKHIFKNDNLKFLFLAAGIWRIFLGIQSSLFVVYIKKYLDRNDRDYGVFMTLIACGCILGGFIGSFIFKKIKSFTLLIVCILIHFSGFILLGILNDFFIVLITVFVSYTFFYVALVRLHSLRDGTTDIYLRGSIYGTVSAALALFGMTSILSAGFFSNLIGVNTIFLICGACAIISYIILIIVLKPYNSYKVYVENEFK